MFGKTRSIGDLVLFNDFSDLTLVFQDLEKPDITSNNIVNIFIITANHFINIGINFRFCFLIKTFSFEFINKFDKIDVSKNSCLKPNLTRTLCIFGYRCLKE